ncbi:DUF3857 domain-containing protein [Paraflavitalea speifideaquila]|uniref:DUF3857 domain-containing protein n=1 Tax=Paraflavitalea speifideaquila TaxID=3076558 RepID=UPI0028E45A51|nr:DUF3857 domain-containing protein [Paraflavitalea speifideiaquila]
MRKMIALITVLGLTLSAFAQKDKDIPAFGTVDKADLLLKECEFDKDAEALVLFDVGEAYLDMMGSIELVHHVRIKILKDKGLKVADIHIPYHSYRNDESIKSLSAQTYNLDAAGNMVITKVEKKLIYEKPLSKRYSEQVFTFPEVKAGSIIEYKYVHTNIGLTSWYFQRAMPVKYSRYRVSFPDEYEFTATPYCVLPVEKKSENKARRTTQTLIMSNIPALRDEPYISCDDDYLQRVETRVLAYNPPYGLRQNRQPNWPQIIKYLAEDEDFGVQLKREIPVRPTWMRL